MSRLLTLAHRLTGRSAASLIHNRMQSCKPLSAIAFDYDSQ